MQPPRVAATTATALLALAATTPALAFAPLPLPPRLLRQRGATVAMSSAPTSEATAAAPPAAQYDGWQAEDGTWYDALGARNGPPVNFWRSSQTRRILEKTAALLEACEAVQSGETSDDSELKSVVAWFGERNGMVKPAAHQKAIGAWDLRSVGQSASQPLKLCMKLLGEVDEEKGKPMAMEMGRDYPLQVVVEQDATEVCVDGVHTTKSATTRAYSFDATQLSKDAQPAITSMLERLSSGVQGMEVVYLDNNIRIERGVLDKSEEGPLFVYVNAEAQLVTKRK